MTRLAAYITARETAAKAARAEAREAAREGRAFTAARHTAEARRAEKQIKRN